MPVSPRPPSPAVFGRGEQVDAQLDPSDEAVAHRGGRARPLGCPSTTVTRTG
jgi:hypothetical protein